MGFAQQQADGIEREIRVIRGCPCFKRFGDEKLCVNDDNVLEVEVIEVDPSLFSFHTTREDILQEQAHEDNICYVSIYVNYPDNRVYCVSQGWELRIHGRHVPGTDLEDALQFLSTKDLSASAEICSECLYKFLLTLSDAFTDEMSPRDRTDEVKRYVDKFSLMIAKKHSQIEGLLPADAGDEIEEGVDHFAFLQEYLVRQLEEQEYWSTVLGDLNHGDCNEWQCRLARLRLLLARLEFQFYSQTLQLRDIYDFNLMVRMLQFILKTADQILTLNKEIHDAIRTDRFRRLVESDPRFARLAKYAEKSRLIEHNFGNILQILGRL